MIQLPGVSQHISDLLVEAGATSPADVLEMGEVGLRSIDGIGQKTAQVVLEAAETASQEPEPPVDVPADDEIDVITPDSLPENESDEPADDQADEPADEPADDDDPEPVVELPPQPPAATDLVDVKLVGVSSATLGHKTIFRDHIMTVRYHDYCVAAANHPRAFLVRRVNETEFHESL